jgi:hypothetical protein
LNGWLVELGALDSTELGMGHPDGGAGRFLTQSGIQPSVADLGSDRHANLVSVPTAGGGAILTTRHPAIMAIRAYLTVICHRLNAQRAVRRSNAGSRAGKRSSFGVLLGGRSERIRIGNSPDAPLALRSVVARTAEWRLVGRVNAPWRP